MNATVIYEFETRAHAEAVAAAAILLPEVVGMSLDRTSHVVSVDIDLTNPGNFTTVSRTIESMAPTARRSFAQGSADIIYAAIAQHRSDI